MFRKRKFKFKNKEKEALDVDITSLLDILVILLVFLLKSYNPSDLKLEVADKLTLPNSKSEKLGHLAPIIQVSSNYDVWSASEKLGNIRGHHGEKIDFLFQHLDKRKKLIEKEIEELKTRELASVENDGLKSKMQNKKKVNIVLDQSLPYSVLRKVMHTAAIAGFPEFKFIVQGNH